MKEISNSGSGIVSFSRVGASMKELSFQSLKPRSQGQPQLRTHATFAEQQGQPQYGEPCSRQLSSRGRRKTPLVQSEGSLEETFRRAQTSIKAHIDLYNQKLTEIVEALNDMQIRDLMHFNEMLENNEQALEKGMVNAIVEIPKEQQRLIYELQKTIMGAIANPIKSFETKTTLDSRNNPRTFSQNSSTVVNRKSFVDSHQNSEADSNLNVTPTGLRLNSKMSSQRQSKNKKSKDSLQDTPQSVKSKLSCVGRVKPEKPANVGMFDRILVCESVEELHESEQPNPNSTTSRKENKQKSEYRYGRMSEE